ncbi:hypothetical protein CDL12_11000 [Handroanthus impetiginosus]|uniref:Uncharacterized protein n=1 Tax=Handroanthus impetiginosus TaxID=429701 RepID=A0A2G9HFT3_9LAMI|nr:hypothetical protein CDL12_11000 [Handroanthus impetiginosus]
MGRKGIVILGLFLAMVLLISSEVLAVRELVETSNEIYTSKEDEKTNGATTLQGCRCCGRIPFRRGCRCCTDADEKKNDEVQAEPHN